MSNKEIQAIRSALMVVYQDEAHVEKLLETCRQTDELEKLRIQSLDAFDKQRERYEREIAALKSKLGEAEKALIHTLLCHDASVGPPKMCAICIKNIKSVLSSLRTPSDGEGKA